MASHRSLTVVKLGGSHAFASHLKSWVAALAGCPGLAVVPGGGPFADSVRAAQLKMGFDDRAAHHMALLAMEQYGCALASLDRRLAPASSLTMIRRALADGHVPVWLPSRMALAARDIPPSWDVTSDSLAAWLAGRLGAARVVLVKQVAIPGGAVRVAELMAQGIVDQRFAGFLKTSGAAGFLAGPADHAALAAAIAGGEDIGTRIE